jgi:hypothetical protein
VKFFGALVGFGFGFGNSLPAKKNKVPPWLALIDFEVQCFLLMFSNVYKEERLHDLWINYNLPRV